jgi:hypothetical protein
MRNGNRVAVLKPPPRDDADADIVINAFSMGVLHRAVPMTVGLCLGVAACVPHTLAWEVLGGRRDANTRMFQDVDKKALLEKEALPSEIHEGEPGSRGTLRRQLRVGDDVCHCTWLSLSHTLKLNIYIYDLC